MGTATLDVHVDVLPMAISMLPSTYKLVGSKDSPRPDIVRFVVWSDDIADDYEGSVMVRVQDVGSTRTITIEPT